MNVKLFFINIGIIFGCFIGFGNYYINFFASTCSICLFLSLSVLFFKRINKDVSSFCKNLALFSVSLFIFLFISQILQENLFKNNDYNSIIKIKYENQNKIEYKKDIFVIYRIDRKENQSLLYIKSKTNSKNYVFYNNIYSSSDLKDRDLATGDSVEIEYSVLDNILRYPEIKDNLISDNGKSFNSLAYWRSLGVEGVISIKDISNVNKNDSKYLVLKTKIRENFTNKMKELIKGEEAAIASAMIIGDDNSISQKTLSIYRDSGLSHILVLSGYNFSVLIVFAIVLFGFLGKRLSIVAGLIATIIFALIIDLDSNTLRAFLFSIITGIGILFSKPAQSIRTFLLILICFMIYNPYLVFYNLSFQLSFLATGSIILFFHKIKDSLILRYKINKIENDKTKRLFYILTDALSLGISVNMLVLPFIIYQFGQFNLMSLLLNILISFLIPVVMLFSLITYILSFISFTLASIVGYLAHISVSFITKSAYLIDVFTIKNVNISLISILFIYLGYFVFYKFLEFYINIKLHERNN